eukprot:Skav225563  [mRNA]  locus=scaffold81:415740:417882:+ [translate_table: standard]
MSRTLEAHNIDDVCIENIRRAEHFIALLRRVVNFFRRYLHVERAQCEGPLSISHKLEEDADA